MQTVSGGANSSGELLALFSKLWAPFTTFRAYMRTRQAVLDGQPLFDLTPQELESRQLMRPLAFNLFQSALSGVPGLILSWLAANRFPAPPGLAIPNVGIDVVDAAVAPSLQWAERLVTPFEWPVFYFLMAVLLSRFAINVSERSPERLRRTRDAYLYFDGAFGLWAQTLIAIAWSTTDVYDRYSLTPDAALGQAMLVWALASLYESTLTLYRIGDRLYRLNGYLPLSEVHFGWLFRFPHSGVPLTKGPTTGFALGFLYLATPLWIAVVVAEALAVALLTAGGVAIRSGLSVLGL